MLNFEENFKIEENQISFSNLKGVNWPDVQGQVRLFAKIDFNGEFSRELLEETPVSEKLTY